MQRSDVGRDLQPEEVIESARTSSSAAIIEDEDENADAEDAFEESFEDDITDPDFMTLSARADVERGAYKLVTPRASPPRGMTQIRMPAEGRPEASPDTARSKLSDRMSSLARRALDLVTPRRPAMTAEMQARLTPRNSARGLNLHSARGSARDSARGSNRERGLNALISARFRPTQKPPGETPPVSARWQDRVRMMAQRAFSSREPMSARLTPRLSARDWSQPGSARAGLSPRDGDGAVHWTVQWCYYIGYFLLSLFLVAVGVLMFRAHGAAQVSSATTLTTTVVSVAKIKHHHNPCKDGEELMAGLCYARCGSLTHGRFPVRASPFSCCEKEPCTEKNTNLTGVMPCQGFDVNEHGSCPEAPGACLDDEELFLGMCYMKCSILTDGDFSNRIAAITCCKDQGFQCLNAAEDKTSEQYNVGGGAGDNLSSTPAFPHAPKKTLDVRDAVDHVGKIGGIGQSTFGGDPLQKILNGFDKNAAGSEKRNSTAGAKPSAPGQSYLPPPPVAHLVIGLTCEDNEEEYEGMCYKKCGLLTKGKFPVRGTAFSCCERKPCTAKHERLGGMRLCHGFNIDHSGDCPHQPTSCKEKEEFFLGQCYPKCYALTKGAYPYRAGPITCCLGIEQQFHCLNPRSNSSVSSKKFGIEPTSLRVPGDGDNVATA